MLSYSQLTAEQVDAISWLPYRSEAFVILPVGFGKTVIALSALKEIRDVYAATDRPAPRALVVSTKAICDLTWGQEIEKWEHLAGAFSYRSAAGRKRDAVEERPDILGVNFESLEWMLDLADEDPSLLPDILVFDESSKMKSHGANRVKRFAGFGARRPGDPRGQRGYVHLFKHRWNLTATPTPEGFTGLWSQEACISMRRRLGQNITSFRREYCEQVGPREHNRYVIGKWGRQAIMDKLAPITYVTRSDDYRGDRPAPVHSAIEVPWTDEGWSHYRELEDTLGLDLHDYLETIGEGDDLTALSAAELEEKDLDVVAAGSNAIMLNKLRQACSGFVYDGGGNARRLDDTGAKLRALEDLRDRVGDAPILVFFQYRAEGEAIGDHFREAVVGLPEDLDEWNAGRVPILALHPASAGHGINLQFGSHVACWFSLPYSYEQWHQGNGRLDRTGQTEQVSIVRLQRPNSVEEQVFDKLMAKQESLEEFIHGIRDRKTAP